MAIEFNRTFGAPSAATNTNTGEQKKSEYWLNIGYEVEGQFENGDTRRFVSLPNGMALDGMEPFKITGNSQEFRKFRSAQNNLLEEVQAAAGKLEPGETKILNLQIEIRRVKGEQAPVEAGDNEFVRKIEL